MYLTSLQNNGQTASISTAVQKRDSLLAAQEIAVADGTDPAVTDSSGSTSGSTSRSSELGHTSSWQPTSQDIARDVLATPSVSPLPSSNPVLDSWKQALNGTTAQTAPIQVSIVESV
jgi:ATP-dependent metalloprotease